MQLKQYVVKARYVEAIPVTAEWFKEGFELPTGVYVHTSGWFKKTKELYIDQENGWTAVGHVGDYFVVGIGPYFMNKYEFLEKFEEDDEL